VTSPPLPTPLPVELLYGIIRWTVVGIDPDSALDPDDYPNADQISGFATFTPRFKVATKTTNPPLTILPQPQKYRILNGRLIDDENRTDVRLLANNSPGVSAQDWSYLVEWQLNDGYSFGSFDFYLVGGETKDLSGSVPLATPSPGVVIVKGDKGDPGPESQRFVFGPVRPTNPPIGTIYVPTPN
jgi:hypothetical protein